MSSHISKHVIDTVVEDINIPRPIHETMLLVAMSGGVDSSAIAALLSHIGYKVIGVTLNLYSDDSGCSTGPKKSKTCCGSRDIQDAKDVANNFGFAHYILDYRKRFNDTVIQKFIDAYQNGKTPIPCIVCNQTVKFSDLLTLATSMEADALITGHYVRRKIIDGIPAMLEAVDPSKDQSYFLGFTTKEQLDFLRFPLGNFYKTETRNIAKELGIAIHDKPDSQDICFIRDGNYRNFIEKTQPHSVNKGLVLDMEGRVIGKHDGTYGFTIGQRRGIEICQQKALYVIKIDAINNTITVGEESHLFSQDIELESVQWLANVDIGSDITAKLRSSQTRVGAKLVDVTKNTVKIRLNESCRCSAPGQACILYQNQVVLGGGIVV